MNKKEYDKILLKLYYQTCQVQQNSSDSSNIMSNNNHFSRLINRRFQFFCDGNVLHTYGHDGPFLIFQGTIWINFQQ